MFLLSVKWFTKKSKFKNRKNSPIRAKNIIFTTKKVYPNGKKNNLGNLQQKNDLNNRKIKKQSFRRIKLSFGELFAQSLGKAADSLRKSLGLFSYFLGSWYRKLNTERNTVNIFSLFDKIHKFATFRANMLTVFRSVLSVL